MESNHFDLVVLGSGPAGQKAAIAAAKMQKKVAVVDKRRMTGGVCIHTGTVPSKTLREAILYLSGFRQRSFYGRSYSVKDQISVSDLEHRVRTVITRQTEVVTDQLRRNGITTVSGAGRFLDPHTIEVDTGDEAIHLGADRILICTGTRPAANPAISLDGRTVFDSDQLLKVQAIPRELIVVGAGVIGLEYASMLAAMNVEVTLIDSRPEVLPFVDREIVDALCYHLRRQNTVFRLGESVAKVVNEETGRVVAHLESGKRIAADALLYAVGRQANTDSLCLEAAGLEAAPRGLLKVNEFFQTAVEHIYAAGDVIGFPSLASTSMEQGRLASCHMFSPDCRSAPSLLPYGIYTIPEISMVGPTERELTEKKVPYEIGLARYEELAKGQMIGDQTGLLKLLFCPDSLKILAVHVIGDHAAEIIHIGQMAIAFGATLEYFRDNVFNYPTLAEAYKTAAFDGLNKVHVPAARATKPEPMPVG